MKLLRPTFIIMIFAMLNLQKLAAQELTPAQVNLKKQAEQMATDFEKGNLEAFVKYTHPKITTMIGGETKMVSVIKNEIGKWAEDGISIQSVSIGDVDKIVTAGNELHSIISQELKMKVPRGILTTKTYLLAISPNKGLKWYFVDSSPLDKEKIKRLFPSFNNQLIIPVKAEPVFTPEQ